MFRIAEQLLRRLVGTNDVLLVVDDEYRVTHVIEKCLVGDRAELEKAHRDRGISGSRKQAECRVLDRGSGDFCV